MGKILGRNNENKTFEKETSSSKFQFPHLHEGGNNKFITKNKMCMHIECKVPTQVLATVLLIQKNIK